MKSLSLAAVTAVILFSSCSVYRQGQTPDDVYYSPGKTQEQAAYVEGNNGRNDGKRYNNQPTYNGYDDYATADDRWLMMRVRNRNRWSYFDDYNYSSPYNSFYSPYSSFGYYPWGAGAYGGYGFGYQPGFSFGLGFGSYYDPYMTPYYWNSYYNPYYPKMVVVNPKTDRAGYNSIRNFNLNSYNNRTYNNGRSILRPRTNGYNNSNSTLGNSFRRVFSNSSTTAPRPSRSNEDYRPSSQDRPVRTYSPSSSSNSTYSPRSSGGGSSGSSSGSSGSRPSRR